MRFWAIAAKSLSALSLTAVLILGMGQNMALAQEVPDSEPKKAQIEAVIRSLENPASRQQLIRQLEIMARAESGKEQENQVKNAAAQALQGLSRRLQSFSEGLEKFISHLREIPAVIPWFQNQLSDPHQRKLWQAVSINILLVLGLGYLGFFILRLAAKRLRRLTSESTAKNSLGRFFRLTWILFLDILPVAVFILVAYAVLSLIDPRENTRLVCLAWVNAFVLANGTTALLHFVFAPSAPGLRLSHLQDASARYLIIWGKRLTHIAVYGFFGLQAALLLKLPLNSYEVLLRLLGLALALLLMFIIFQSRETVARYIQKRETESSSFGNLGGLRRWLAGIWHLIAALYVILLYGVWALRIPDGFLYLLRSTLLTAVILVIGVTLRRFVDRLLHRELTVEETLKIRYPNLEKQAKHYLSIFHRILRGLLWLVIVLAIAQSWGLDLFSWLWSEPGRVLAKTMAKVAGILLAAIVLWEISSGLIESFLVARDKGETIAEVSARTKTLLTVARKALSIVLTVIATLMILAELGVQIGPLLAGAGVLGLAVGFGAQKLVQDIITGIFILLEDQASVGDVVDLGGRAGVVEAVSIRTLRLRDLSGTVHTIPYSAITTVSNLTKEFSYYILDVGIAYREDVDEVMDVLREIGREMREDPEFGPHILEPLEVLGVDSFADSAVVIKARIKTRPIKQWWIGREFNRRMKKRFDELDIEIPFPHQTLYFGVDKDGNAPPMRIKGDWPQKKNDRAPLTDD